MNPPETRPIDAHELAVTRTMLALARLLACQEDAIDHAAGCDGTCKGDETVAVREAMDRLLQHVPQLPPEQIYVLAGALREAALLSFARSH